MAQEQGIDRARTFVGVQVPRPRHISLVMPAEVTGATDPAGLADARRTRGHFSVRLSTVGSTRLAPRCRPAAPLAPVGGTRIPSLHRLLAPGNGQCLFARTCARRTGP